MTHDGPDLTGRVVKSDLRGRISETVFGLGYRIQDVVYWCRDVISDAGQVIRRSLTQMTSAQIVAAAGVLLVFLAVVYGWAIYEVFHPRNGIH